MRPSALRAFLTESVTVATDKKDVFDRVIGLIKMFGDRRRISKVAIVENGAAMLPKRLWRWRLVSPIYCLPHFLHSMR